MPHRKIRLITWLLVLAFVAIGVVWAIIRQTGTGSSQQPLPTRQFQVGTHPIILVGGNVGSIRVRVGDNNRVVVKSTLETRMLSGNVVAAYILRDPQHLDIIVNAPPFNILGSNTIDFDMAVPEEADLQLQASTGDVDVSGVHGQLIASSATGAVNVTQVILTGTGKLQTVSGLINFDGSIISHAHYTFASNVGSLYVKLPVQSSLHLDATTVSGTIHTTRSDIQVKNGTFIGGNAHGDLDGNTLSALLSLQTNTGSITIQ